MRPEYGKACQTRECSRNSTLSVYNAGQTSWNCPRLSSDDLESIVTPNHHILLFLVDQQLNCQCKSINRFLRQTKTEKDLCDWHRRIKEEERQFIIHSHRCHQNERTCCNTWMRSIAFLILIQRRIFANVKTISSKSLAYLFADYLLVNSFPCLLPPTSNPIRSGALQSSNLQKMIHLACKMIKTVHVYFCPIPVDILSWD